jgi:hypothetical protein
MYLQKVGTVITEKRFTKILFVVGVLKVSDENGRIRIHQSEAWISGSGSSPTCHGSETLGKIQPWKFHYFNK